MMIHEQFLDDVYHLFLLIFLRKQSHRAGEIAEEGERLCIGAARSEEYR